MTIQAVRGTRDILPDEVAAWHRIEAAARDLFARYGYREIRTPGLRGDRALRPRASGRRPTSSRRRCTRSPTATAARSPCGPRPRRASCARSSSTTCMNTDPALKVYALGPMFRRERPQKGRYRQFHQVDVEAFGFTSPTIDAEVIELALAYLDACGVARARAGPQLRGRPRLPAGLRRAAARGPAGPRPLDVRATASGGRRRTRCASSTARCPRTRPRSRPCPGSPTTSARACARALRRGAPAARAARHPVPARATAWCAGLDYYVRTTFEVTSGRAGGAEQRPRRRPLRRPREGPRRARRGRHRLRGRHGAPGPPRARPGEGEPRCDVFLMPLAAAALDRGPPAPARAAAGRASRALLDPEGRSFKSRMKQADKLGARFVAILGDDEMARGVWTVRDMARSEQQDVPEERVLDHLEGEGEWLSRWATSRAPTTAGSCARTTWGRRSPSWAGRPPAATSAGSSSSTCATARASARWWRGPRSRRTPTPWPTTCARSTWSRWWGRSRPARRTP